MELSAMERRVYEQVRAMSGIELYALVPSRRRNKHAAAKRLEERGLIRTKDGIHWYSMTYWGVNND